MSRTEKERRGGIDGFRTGPEGLRLKASRAHRLNDIDELWVPDGNHVPQYDLAWRRYQAELTTEYIAWQVAIVREYATPDQFVTTCIDPMRPAVDDRAIGAAGGPSDREAECFDG